MSQKKKVYPPKKTTQQQAHRAKLDGMVKMGANMARPVVEQQIQQGALVISHEFYKQKIAERTPHYEKAIRAIRPGLEDVEVRELAEARAKASVLKEFPADKILDKAAPVVEKMAKEHLAEGIDANVRLYQLQKRGKRVKMLARGVLYFLIACVASGILYAILRLR